MKIEFDPVKSARNTEERGLPFDMVESFEWERAVIRADTRYDYGEERFGALSFINNRLHNVVFRPTATGVRVISFRKANKKEQKYYEKETLHR